MLKLVQCKITSSIDLVFICSSTWPCFAWASHHACHTGTCRVCRAWVQTTAIWQNCEKLLVPEPQLGTTSKKFMLLLHSHHLDVWLCCDSKSCKHLQPVLDGKLLHKAWVLLANVFLLYQKIKIKIERGAHEKMVVTSSPQGVSEVKELCLQTSSKPRKKV